MSKSKENAKVIGDLVALIMKLGVNFAQNQVENRIKNPLVEKGVALIFPLTKELIEVLSDANANNEAQVRQVMLKWTNGPLAEYLEEIFAEFVSKQKDKDVKALLEFLTKKFVEALRIYSDDEEENRQQIEKLWEGIITDEKTITLIVEHIIKPLLIKAQATEEWVKFATDLSITLLKGLIQAKPEAPQLQTPTV